MTSGAFSLQSLSLVQQAWRAYGGMKTAESEGKVLPNRLLAGPGDPVKCPTFWPNIRNISGPMELQSVLCQPRVTQSEARRVLADVGTMGFVVRTGI